MFTLMNNSMAGQAHSMATDRFDKSPPRAADYLGILVVTVPIN
jgi:hypothetical protein